MEEKDQNSLTIGNILDQLIKPPITQTPEPVSNRPISQPSSVTPPQLKAEAGIKLPELGKGSVATPTPSQDAQSQSAEISLLVRTMSDDINRLKKGKTEPVQEVRKIPTPDIKIPQPPEKPPRPPIAAPPPPPKMTPTPNIIPTRPSISSRPPIPAPPPLSKSSLPPLKPTALPPISAPTPHDKEETHFHPEKVVSQDEMLPAFLGAPLPKKVKKPTEEKVQYKLIAKIIGSGMTMGITITLIMAATAYGLLYFFYIRKVETPIITPSPTPVKTDVLPVINELETIFNSISIIDFELPTDKQTALPDLKSFTKNQTLAAKETRRLNLTSQGQKISSLTDLLENLSVNYPQELKNEVTGNVLFLLYGQEEIFNSPTTNPIPKKLVLISEIKDPAKTLEILSKWEQTISNDLKEIAEINPLEQASPTFVDNERRGVKIRYKNFPLPDRSIDYAIVTSLTKHHYLIITSSRESMYYPSDKIRGL